MVKKGDGTGQMQTRLCLPPVHICDPRPSLLSAGVKIPERIVAFMSQDTQVVLGLIEPCTGPMFISAKLENTLNAGAEEWEFSPRRTAETVT
jgi:hypothetical protein